MAPAMLCSKIGIVELESNYIVSYDVVTKHQILLRKTVAVIVILGSKNISFPVYLPF